MSLWLMDKGLNRYDFLKADLSGFPVDVRRNIIDLAFSHGGKDIADQKIEPRKLRLTSILIGEAGGFVRQLDDCGDTSNVEDWVEGYDGLNPVENEVYVKQGFKSMALGVDADLNGSDEARWINISDLGNLSNYKNDWLYLWVYFPTLNYVAPSSDVFLYSLGSSATDRNRYIWIKSDLSVGWNLLTIAIDNPTSSIGTIDWTKIDYQRIQVFEATGNENDFTFYVDDLKIWRKSYQAEWDDFMRQIGKTDLTFWKNSGRYINIESMGLKSHVHIIGDSKSRAEVELFCPDPFWYKSTETTESEWTVTSSPDTEDIFNEGNIDVFPIIEITASADLSGGVTLENQTDGNVSFTYTDPNFTSGKKLTVDCVNGTVDLDGTDTINYFTGQFLRLLAGSNILEYTGGNCSIVIKHRDRWL